MTGYTIEGEPFVQATDTLLTTDFRISQFDRHLPAGSEVATIFGDAGSGNDDGSGGTAGLLEPAAPDNKPNHDKYRYPMYAVRVWGKSGSELMCGGDDCGDAVFELATNQKKRQ